MENWFSFYTPTDLADRIIKLIPINFNPQSVVDICAGSGNFLDSAIKRWNVKALGIDLDPKKTENKNYIIYKHDALNINNLKSLALTSNKLVVANPPFGKLDKIVTTICNKHYELQQEAIKSKRIETNMIVSNMSILKNDEIFAAILPENIFSANSLVNFRDAFLSYFDVLYLGDPDKYFKGSEVKTRIFIGKYTSTPRKKMLFESNGYDLSSLKFQITRGIDNSKLLKNLDNLNEREYTRVVHFSNKSSVLKLARYTKTDSHLQVKKICKNDVLISRVGRNTGKIHRVKKIFVNKYASDYFFIFKDGQLLVNDLDELEKKLIKKSAGLTVKYLRKVDILKELVNLKK